MATRRKTAPPRGILRTASADPVRTHHLRYHPSVDLQPYVEHYWSVEWDFREATPERVENLPHPSVHLIFQRPVGDRIMGVAHGKFSRLLHGAGGVFAVKFTPGGFHPFLRRSVSSISNRTVTLHEVFGDDGDALARRVQGAATDDSRIVIVEDFLRDRVRPDADAVRAAGLVYAMARDRTILRVRDLADRHGTTARALQRLFAKYVGVSPKWVIQRYRLHEAAEQLAAGGVVDQVALALSLGYSDQAHFVRDFKAVVGMSPAAYAKRAGAAAHPRSRGDP